MNIIIERNRISYVNEYKEELAFIEFPDKTASVVVIKKTYVNDQLRGMGIASKLMKAACEEIRLRHKKAIMECSYAKEWIKKHPEYQDILF